MSEPSELTFRVIAEDLDIELSSEHLENALGAHRIFRPKLQELRQLKLPYLDCIEPADVRQWIENGGRSVQARGKPTP